MNCHNNIRNNEYQQPPCLKKKNHVVQNSKTEIKEFNLKENNFNPSKGSPNFFMTKLEFRMNNYFKEVALNSDSLSL